MKPHVLDRDKEKVLQKIATRLFIAHLIITKSDNFLGFLCFMHERITERSYERVNHTMFNLPSRNFI